MDAVRRKRPEKWPTNIWFLLYDNAPEHQSVLVYDFRANNNVTTQEHPLNPPDHASADFYLFPRLKSTLKGRCFFMLMLSLKCDGKTEKAFRKWLPGMSPKPLQTLAEVPSCVTGLFWRKCSLNDCRVLYVSEIKWFRKHFEATAYNNISENGIHWAISCSDYLVYTVKPFWTEN
jgi:hypothetical protein